MKLGMGPSHFAGRRKKLGRNGRKNRKSQCRIITLVLLALLVLLIVYVTVIFRFQLAATTIIQTDPNTGIVASPLSVSNSNESCQLRKYPPRRYYGLNNHDKEGKNLPDFLQTEYIYGKAPRLLQTSSKNYGGSTKLCVDQSPWYQNQGRLPYADGTNPSLLRIVDNPKIHSSITGMFPAKAYYLATICMTDSQCSWKDSPQEQIEYKLSTQNGPSTVRTVLLVLDEHFHTIQEATVYTLIDANFGRRIRPKENGNLEKRSFALDDARLFTYQGDIWISYREGKVFGYDKQVLNRLHISTSPSLEFTLKASEVETLCCGRNMALIDNVKTNELQALTWVDPVTVVNVELKNKQKSDIQHRHLAEQKKGGKKSHFHGTNGYMVYLSETNEYLGIGHFHRPPSRDFNNQYARFGHHYTHAFFTISDEAPFHLKRLSSELLLPSSSYQDDAEIIQFWSGLERVDSNTIAIAYGINDCEGAATYVDMSTIEELLESVPEGKEVVDLMELVK